MQQYYVDLHIHLGRTNSGKPVKITASKTMTLPTILHEALNRKGLEMVGIIDCHVPEVQNELEDLLSEGEMTEHVEGGLCYRNLTVILGCEIEVFDEHCKGPVHVLVYFPTLAKMKEFTHWLESRLKNITLSTQRMYGTAVELQQKVKSMSGLFIPAHIFTPYKSLYGKGVASSLTEIFDPQLIDAVELGLSADSYMADQIMELHNYTYLSNSDAHSVGKIAREYQVIQMKTPSFQELKKALHNESNREVVANYGLDPKLGKYYHAVCERCFATMRLGEGCCVKCGHKKIIKGVYYRLKELKNTNSKRENRPSYIHQVPLEFIPGIGKKTLQNLLDHFQTEMAIIHQVPEKSLLRVVNRSIVNSIMNARNGTLCVETGGGGKYGRVK
ncbi:MULTISPECIES: endonuclease Q family protein [Bacillaceae]|uniref:endonuclease Q family protein n=1 Tax=Bacillaceae TaxID=186817 RepID=UPI002A0AE47D|nr:endonuclease Q family protein [Cytobacillus sp. IB215316]MDX8359729.1 endonuclease Q family protein [Cytobacillus sp. IB215316]